MDMLRTPDQGNHVDVDDNLSYCSIERVDFC